MNLVAYALRFYVPSSLRRRKLKSLFEATAKAFEVDVPSMNHLSYKRCLEKYALFTKEEVDKRLREGNDMHETRTALYLHAYGLGKEIRERLGLKTTDDVLKVGRSLYRSIGIDFQGSSIGTVMIHSCFFSRFYSEGTCRVMSALDEGIAAGLSGGGKLSFSQRITEGKPCCEAYLEFEDLTE